MLCADAYGTSGSLTDQTLLYLCIYSLPAHEQIQWGGGGGTGGGEGGKNL